MNYNLESHLSGGMVCSLDVVQPFATVRNRPQPFATVRNRLYEDRMAVPIGSFPGGVSLGRFRKFHVSRSFVSCGRCHTP